MKTINQERGLKTIDWLKANRDPKSFASQMDEVKQRLNDNYRLNESREYRNEAEGSWNE